MSVPSSVIVPPAMCPPPGSSRMIDSAVIVLPLPDSPTMPRHSPGSTARDTPSTACTTDAAQLDLRLQVFNGQQCRHRRCSLTSNASRNASPMKLTAMTMITINAPAG